MSLTTAKNILNNYIAKKSVKKTDLANNFSNFNATNNSAFLNEDLNFSGKKINLDRSLSKTTLSNFLSSQA